MAGSHVVVGLASWVATAPLLHLSAADPIYLGLVVAGSLLPDLDHPKSWVGRRVWPLSRIIAAILGHRGITHSAIAVAGMASLLLYAGTREAWVDALVVGYLSHLAADLLTPRGLRLAWPLPGRWALPICRTGSPAEPLIVFLLLLGLGWWMWRGVQFRF